VRIDARPPFPALFTRLSVDDRRRWARFAFGLFATLHVERVMDAIQNAVPSPVAKVAIHRALGRQILGDVAPLGSRAEHIHDAVEHFPHVGLTLAAAPFGRGNERLDMRPFFVRHVARITPLVAIVFHPVFVRPHRRPPTNQTATLESQAIHGIQHLSRRTLNNEVRKNAGRRLSKEQHDVISAAVRREPPIRFTVAFDGNDPETSVFAADLIVSFEDGGAVVNAQPSAIFIGQRPVFGLLLQASQGFDATKIEIAILTAASLGKSESLKNFPAQSRADIFSYVGHKPQAF
jgi:hypothetical protein